VQYVAKLVRVVILKAVEFTLKILQNRNLISLSVSERNKPSTTPLLASVFVLKAGLSAN
jgi:uncharacterized membrane protein YadS